MDLNQLKQVSLNYFQKGKKIAAEAAEKSRVEVLVLNNKTKLYRAQRQLGALVYSLAKGNEENQPLVDKYIAVIASVEQEIETLKASLTPAQKAAVEEAETKADESEAVAEPVVVEEVSAEPVQEPAQQEPAEYVVVETELVEEEKPVQMPVE